MKSLHEAENFTVLEKRHAIPTAIEHKFVKSAYGSVYRLHQLYEDRVIRFEGKF